MELKATTLGKRLAQHPYDRAVILNAGIKVSGDRHEYLIPFNQLLAIHCKRGLVWGELEFVLPGRKSGASARHRMGRDAAFFTIILMLTGGGGVAR
ncbi:DNA helicase IV [Escherichia coli]|uniref:DNA helicase IV n=1 Tax=Escherichia coli TaxID=562 RepID=A0A377E5R5_ECOLX|nr:DNA helicase IV [Escherichia coli]